MGVHGPAFPLVHLEIFRLPNLPRADRRLLVARKSPRKDCSEDEGQGEAQPAGKADNPGRVPIVQTLKQGHNQHREDGGVHNLSLTRVDFSDRKFAGPFR
jgi:hypothetical protein